MVLLGNGQGRDVVICFEPMAPLLATWSATATQDIISPILPDGCRDLICWQRPGAPPRWFISPLQTATTPAFMRAGDQLHGFRLRPGAKINEAALLQVVSGRAPNPAAIALHLNDFTRLTDNTREALACLAQAQPVAKTAAELGVSTRSLQRLIRRETSQDPGFWRQLSRIRNAARLVASGAPLVEAAYGAGYADQAHMSRDFRRWFGLSPSGFAAQPRLSQQLDALGYG